MVPGLGKFGVDYLVYVGRFKVDVDDIYKPNLTIFNNIIVQDFAKKILEIYQELGWDKMPTNIPHCYIYPLINDRWRKAILIPKGSRVNRLSSIVDSAKEQCISSAVAIYIKDELGRSNPLGLKIPTPEDIRRWCGGGEFPFLCPSLIQNKVGSVFLTYYLSR